MASGACRHGGCTGVGRFYPCIRCHARSRTGGQIAGTPARHVRRILTMRGHRSRRPIPVDRLEKLERLRNELAEAAGLSSDSLSPSDKLRGETAVWLQLSLDNARNDILAGVTLDPSTCERISNAVRELLPPAQRPHELTVKLVQGETLCSKCQSLIESEQLMGTIDDGFRPAPGYVAPVKEPSGSPRKPAAASAPSPPNVVPLRPDAPAQPTSVAGMVAKVNSGAGTRSPFDVPFGTRFDNTDRRR